MPFTAGEQVDWIPMVTDHPERATFQLVDESGDPVMLPLTVKNGGLVLRRKGRLHPVFTLPQQPGKYAYRFWDGSQVLSGHVRVQAPTTTASNPTPPPAPATEHRPIAPRTQTQAMGLIE